MAPDDDTPPRDWSQLGRRVLAEAWRRFTEEHVTRPPTAATPVASAPPPAEVVP